MSTGACRTHVQLVHDVLTASATLPSEEMKDYAAGSGVFSRLSDFTGEILQW